LRLAHQVWIASAVDEQTGAASSLAMIRFGKVDEFEIEREGTSELMCCRGVFGRSACECTSFFQTSPRSIHIARQFSLPASNAGAAESLDLFEEFVSGLLAEYLAE
jgi:hypothetical protein